MAEYPYYRILDEPDEFGNVAYFYMPMWAHYPAQCGKIDNIGVDDMADGQGNFVVKDSGKRESFSSGMVRDVTEDKTDFTLALDGPMFERLAIHLTKGAKKYAKRNWMKAEGEEELARFRESAVRHFVQWYNGDTDEDHAAAVFFNINGYEYVAGKKSRVNKVAQAEDLAWARGLTGSGGSF